MRSPLPLLVRTGLQELPSLPKARFSGRKWAPLSLQEVNILKCQLGDRLRIELDTEPTVDLSRVLDNMRCQYEAMVETHRRDVEQWFQAQVGGAAGPGAGQGRGSRLPAGREAITSLCFSRRASACRPRPAPRSCSAASRRSWS